jgi:hypothetical protein
MRSDLKVANFTVGATQEQSIRWKRAAEAESFRSVGAWASRALDAYLRVRAKAGLPTPLSWHLGTFLVVLMDGQEVRVRGTVSPPFATYRGTDQGPDGNNRYTLTHLPSKRVIATLKTARQARALASELAPLYVRDEAGASAIVERHRREAT